MKAYRGKRPGTTISFHRPLHVYVNTLAACGLLVDRMQEITTQGSSDQQAKADQLAEQEIPLFLALRAWKVER
jgi:hypothetical protein